MHRLAALAILAATATAALGCRALEVPWRHHYDARHPEHRAIYEMCRDEAGPEGFDRCMHENLPSLPSFGERVSRVRR